jgi:DNA-binding GntR family transcriptional regulator
MYVRAWTDDDRAEVLALLDALILLSVQLSVERLTAEDLGQLEAIIEETRASKVDEVDDRVQIERDAQFHLIIARRSGNRRLVELMENLMLPLLLYIPEAHEYLKPDFWLHIHADLLETLQRRDFDAAVACCLRNARESRAILLKKTADDGQRSTPFSSG